MSASAKHPRQKSVYGRDANRPHSDEVETTRSNTIENPSVLESHRISHLSFDRSEAPTSISQWYISRIEETSLCKMFTTAHYMLWWPNSPSAYRRTISSNAFRMTVLARAKATSPPSERGLPVTLIRKRANDYAYEKSSHRVNAHLLYCSCMSSSYSQLHHAKSKEPWVQDFASSRAYREADLAGLIFHQPPNDTGLMIAPFLSNSCSVSRSLRFGATWKRHWRSSYNLKIKR